MGHTDNAVEIKAPIGYVWERTNDLRSWPDLFTEYSSVEVLSETADRVVFRLTMHPADDGTVFSWVSERRPDRDTWTVRAKRIETGWFEYMSLCWTYEPLGDDVTRMRWTQDFAMRPDAPLDDATMRARLDRGAAVQMDVIRRRLEERRSSVTDFSAVAANRARGGDMRTLISPRTVGSATALSGLVELAPGERVDEHYHPYSEEHLVVVEGRVRADLDGRPVDLRQRQAILVPRHVRHRLTNVGDVPALVVFALSPLAPRPELGHVDTETEPRPEPSADIPAAQR